MKMLESIESLVENVSGKIKAVIDDREEMMAEIVSLRERLAERDEEAMKAAQDMRLELEAARMDALRFEQDRFRIEAKLQGLNDRLFALVDDVKG